ncbi:hypothetical protein [Methanohalophilus profundi]|uniref:hypothetical protein n=1 Tax=Methanohalophilus profundi TaxID=2138083 RepID=UPI00101D8AC0|nr:hypothetical protein [Methanohalophilus profundi]
MNIKKLLCLLVIVIISIIPAASEENIFYDLSSKEISELSFYYQNNSTFPLNEFYTQSSEYSSEYPFYSYNLALKCHRIIMKMDMYGMASDHGTKIVIDDTFDEIESKNNEIDEQLADLNENNLSFSGMEWLSLAENEIEESRHYFSISQEHYDNGNFNDTLETLIKSNFAIYKAENLLNVAKYKNNESSKINHIQRIEGGEEIASKWIQVADEQIKILSEAGNRKDILASSENILETAKQHYSAERYYLATMNAAEAKALADFGIDYKKVVGHKEAIRSAEKQMENTNASLSSLFGNPEIDAPIIVLHFESAKIRLKESRIKNSTSSIPLADISIRNALIAKEQANAIVELKNTIEAIDTSSQSEPELIPLGLSPLIGAIAILIMFRGKKW